MRKSYPLVSIAIITFNQKEFLRECIESCLAQDYPNFEIVIADDCSVDGTQDMLREYDVKYPKKFLLLLANKNQGITKNCNAAWRSCNGEWIKSIAGDDKLTTSCLSIYMNEIICSNQASDVYFANMQRFDENGPKDIVKSEFNFFSLTQVEKVRELLKFNRLQAATSFINKKVLHESGYANEAYTMIEDYPLWLKFAFSGKSFNCIDKTTVFYRVHDSVSQSSRKIANLQYEKDFYSFKKNEIWPNKSVCFFQKLDDWGLFQQKKIGVILLNNKNGFGYALIRFSFFPFRLNTIFRRLNEWLFL